MSPKTLMESVRVKHPIEQVVIRGRVGDVRPFPPSKPHTIYADLELDNSRIQITCPIDCSPCEGDYIIFSGVLTVPPAKGKAGFLKMMVKGEPVGRWTSSEFGSAIIRPERKHPVMSLKKLIEVDAPQSLRIIGSKRAIQDLQTEMANRCQIDNIIDVIECSVENKNELYEAFRDTVNNPKYKAALFTRGGAEGSIGDVWDDHKFVKGLLDLEFPFFTAIGHSDAVTLSEKLADKAFATPTAAGAEIGNIINELSQIRVAHQNCKNAENERDEEQRKSSALEAELKRGASKNALLMIFLVVSILALIGTLVVVGLIK